MSWHDIRFFFLSLQLINNIILYGAELRISDTGPRNSNHKLNKVT